MLIRNIARKSKFLQLLWRNFNFVRTKFLLKFKPEIIANIDYKSVFKKNINWDNPTDLIEKIKWLQLYSDTTLWTKCADKYLVREYVKEKGCEDTLTELYGRWDNAKDIDWSKLPNSFVLKTNHGCGHVILVKDKNTLNISQIVKQLNRWIRIKYGFFNAQLHYTKIKPCIIAEKMFINKNESNKSLIDYKIWCFHGVPEFVLVVYDRTEESYSLSSYDLDWNNISNNTFNKNDRHYSGAEISRPESLHKMIEVAKKLSKDIPQVRVDFYDIDGDVIFGEMTFTTGFGYFSKDFYNYLGSKINLEEVKKISKVNTI